MCRRRVAALLLPDIYIDGRVQDSCRRPTPPSAEAARRYVFNIEAAATDSATYEADGLWVRNFWDAMRPQATGAGGYVNFMVEQDKDRVRTSVRDRQVRAPGAHQGRVHPTTFFTSTRTSDRRDGPPDR